MDIRHALARQARRRQRQLPSTHIRRRRQSSRRTVPDPPHDPDSLPRALELITEICPGYNLGKAYKRVSRAFELEFRSGDLTLPQFALLVNIGREEPATGTEVAERLGSDVSTVSRTIEAVVQRGLVRQSRGTDRRVREYRLTEAGREELRNAIPRWHEAKDRVLEKVGTHSWNSTLHILKQVGT